MMNLGSMHNNYIRSSEKWLLVIYDLLIYAFLCVFFFGIIPHAGSLTALGIVRQTLSAAVIVCCRLALCVYKQIWRYGGIQSYLRLVLADAIAFLLFYFIQKLCLFEKISLLAALALFSLNLLTALVVRMLYRYTYKLTTSGKWYIKVLCRLFTLIGGSVEQKGSTGVLKSRTAIIGAGRTGSFLAEELINSEFSIYTPVLFVDINPEKVGREIFGIPVIGESEITAQKLNEYGVQEVIIAAQISDADARQKLVSKYMNLGCKVKTYDYPFMQNAGRRSVREFDIEELLFRKPVEIQSQTARDYYCGKRILITGGGGSIGSEICRQLAQMDPERLIILDICENGAYDIQQEIKIKYKGRVQVDIEIASVTDKTALRRVFEEYRPQVIIMAAAHKHVPLMEKNCIEAVNNNVFGTLNTVEISEEYCAERVIMVSTDKAVNPTNVMGATKRMCELIIQAHSATGGKTTFSATRFGNVLGSAGSVIPLFKMQIAQGGPVTVTDKRIIRYFMTIPEASKLVLLSGAMAKNGELFVLDMGQPVKIYDLAESMIHLSGADNIEIIETGLRPGEKLYEELLVRSEELGKTENELIFTEYDQPLSMEQIDEKLRMLREAIDANNDYAVRTALHQVIPTYVESNRTA